MNQGALDEQLPAFQEVGVRETSAQSVLFEEGRFLVSLSVDNFVQEGARYREGQLLYNSVAKSAHKPSGLT